MGAAAALLVACAPSWHVLTGTPRPPTSPSQVKIYSDAPPTFEEIAVLQASRKSIFKPDGERSTARVVERLKAEAAKVGANGIIIEGFDQTQTGSIGSGAGSDSYSAHGSISVGLGASVGIFKTTAKGRAIFVPPG
ncbi:MAG: hypothetical protein ABSG18_08480 [Steroidobacteraceae bacterium]